MISVIFDIYNIYFVRCATKSVTSGSNNMDITSVLFTTRLYFVIVIKQTTNITDNQNRRK